MDMNGITAKISISSACDNPMIITRARKRAGSGNQVCPYIYIYVYKKIVIEQTRGLIYLKFIATAFFPKIISHSAGENSGDLA